MISANYLFLLPVAFFAGGWIATIMAEREYYKGIARGEIVERITDPE